MKRNILVSVVVVAYNHALYIRQTLQSMINQRTDFDYEILIHDDASTDGTIEILKEYEDRYPDLIRVFYEKENTWQKKTLKKVLDNIYMNEAVGKYYAVVDGDDFWCDTNKLQIQVDYMEAHPECVLTGHNGLKYDMRTGEMIPMDGFTESKEVSMDEILDHKNLCFPSASFLERRDKLEHDKIYDECKVGDWLCMINSRTQGTVYYFDRVMSVYRFAHPGSWTNDIYNNVIKHTVFVLDMARFFTEFNKLTNNEYAKKTNVIIDGFYLSGANSLNLSQIDDWNKLKEEVYGDLQFTDEAYWQKLMQIKEEKKNEIDLLKEFANTYKYVYIMGTGDGANTVTEIASRYGIEFEGYVVSNNQLIRSEYHGKKVWHLNEIKYDHKEVGIIIAIQQKLKKEIEQSLRENRFENYRWCMM